MTRRGLPGLQTALSPNTKFEAVAALLKSLVIKSSSFLLWYTFTDGFVFKRLQRAHFCELMKILCFCSVSHLGKWDAPKEHHASSRPASGRRASPAEPATAPLFPSDPQTHDKARPMGCLLGQNQKTWLGNRVWSNGKASPFKALVQYLVPVGPQMLIYKSES